MRYDYRYLVTSIFLFFNLLQVFSQQGLIKGFISDSDQQPLYPVNISLKNSTLGTVSQEDGSYEIYVPAGRYYTLVYSYLGFTSQEKTVFLQAGEILTVNIVFSPEYREIDEVNISAKGEMTGNMTRISIKPLQMLPGTAGGVETLIKSLPGVSSANELSSQYSVRGGNYDENLVYVNHIEIYRPFLIRSGQQEGLSFINNDMVASIRFSAGGFDASYGDRMSSVLDISYKNPETTTASVSGNLLGGSFHFEGLNKNGKLSYLSGLRYKTTSYLLNSLDIKGDYKPDFLDFQTLINYTLTEKTEFSVLGNISKNQYNFIPKTRKTDFGTVNTPLNLVIYFDGNESDSYDVYQGALSFKYKPRKNLVLYWITNSFNSLESERYDISGEYLINELDNTIGSETYGDSILNIGIGAFINHARNYLDARVWTINHSGELDEKNHNIKWGVSYRSQKMNDKLNEWEMIDSAGFSLPRDPFNLHLFKLVKADNSLLSENISSYIQDTWHFPGGINFYSLTGGIRTSFIGFNRELLISPRFNFIINPRRKKDIMFKFSGGIYYQPPFYKEMRKPDGELNKQLKSQKSTHIVIGSDYLFSAWDRPFKFSTEIYFKDLKNLVPYKMDNINLRYAGENLAIGYSTGLDLKLYGEFVKDAESWLSISLMRTREDIKDDFYFEQVNGQLMRIEPGYYPRPTDQLIHAAVFFQDYFPNNPDYKMQLIFHYGSRLPFSSPKEHRYDELYRLPPYRRVDIGFSKIIKKLSNEYYPGKKLGFLKTTYLSLEIFNLLGMNNTISYLWVRTISNQENIPGMYAVPNYLTSRRINLKLTINI